MLDAQGGTNMLHWTLPGLLAAARVLAAGPYFFLLPTKSI
jgi:hypothetical protein